MFCSFVQNMCLFYYNTEHLFCQGGVFLVLFMEKVPKPPLRVDEGVTFSFEKVTKENRSFADWNSLNSSVSFAAKAILQVIVRFCIPSHKCYLFFSANKYYFLSLL